MIPEEAKSEIRKRKEAGATWTGIAQWIANEYGIDIHRTTIQRWHDKEVYLDFQEPDDIIVETDTPAERIKLDKKVVTHKAEATFYKKLYEQAIKDSAKKEIIVDAIKNNEIDIIINTPLGGVAREDEYAIGKSAIRYKVPVFTTLSGAKAAVRAIRTIKLGNFNYRSLQEIFD